MTIVQLFPVHRVPSAEQAQRDLQDCKARLELDLQEQLDHPALQVSYANTMLFVGSSESKTLVEN